MPRLAPKNPSTWAVLALCAVAQFMVVLDVSIVNVALPEMRHDLGLSVTGQQWVVNAYTLTFAGFLMLGGRAGDLFGRRRVFMAGPGSVHPRQPARWSGAGWCVVDRRPGRPRPRRRHLGAEFTVILTSTFTDPTERRRAIGVWSAIAASGRRSVCSPAAC